MTWNLCVYHRDIPSPIWLRKLEDWIWHCFWKKNPSVNLKPLVSKVNKCGFLFVCFLEIGQIYMALWWHCHYLPLGEPWHRSQTSGSMHMANQQAPQLCQPHGFSEPLSLQICNEDCTGNLEGLFKSRMFWWCVSIIWVAQEMVALYHLEVAAKKHYPYY